MRRGHTYAFVAGPEDLPFTKPDVKWRAGKLNGAVCSGALDDNDIDCACEGGGVDLVVVVVRGTDCADGASQVVHGYLVTFYCLLSIPINTLVPSCLRFMVKWRLTARLVPGSLSARAV
jgi:hypothetical protein